jgi:putative restriction endonuclease
MTSIRTSNDALRQRILAVLSSTSSGSLSPKEALDRMSVQFRWTDDDLSTPSQSAPARWRLRARYERDAMASEGLIDHVDSRQWKLTPEGRAIARTEATIAIFRQQEFERREQMWSALLANGGPNDVSRGLLRELKIYGNQAGIYVPSAETRTPGTPKGVALSFLHTGKHYEDELTETGVIYHYPATGRKGHDESEIEASKEAWEAAVPVFVIGPGSKSTTRTVHRGFIENVDDDNRVLLITFTNAQFPYLTERLESDALFNLTDEEDGATYSQVKNRPNQLRFAFGVQKRYGTKCAVCGLNIQGLIQAAHLLSKKLGGSDDARNGLPLCANHHLAFDRGYWCMDPNLKLHAAAGGPALDDLAIIRADLSHLPQKPHADALARIWTDWKAKQGKSA